MNALSRIAVAALALSAAACGDTSKAAAGGDSPPPVPVRVAVAERRDVPVRVRAVGTVESPNAVVLKPRLDGEVAAVHLKEGEDVQAGDLLLELDKRGPQAAVAAAQAALARDKAMADDAARTADSWAGVPDQRAVSQRTLESARAVADAAAANVRADEAALQRAQLDIAWSEIRAPFAGRTGKLLVRAGSSVKANDTELLSLQQITPIRVAFALPESELPRLAARRKEAPLEVEVDVPGGGSARGVLDFVDNAVDPETGTILLHAELANADRALWPGQLVDVALTVAVQKDAVIVPSMAVQPGQGHDLVFVVGADSAVEIRTVEVARIDGDTAVIAEGLKGDETVVTDGQLRLVAGTRIVPRTP